MAEQAVKSHDTTQEPWLRGIKRGHIPVVEAAFNSFQQIREDLDTWTVQLSDAELWERPLGLNSVGFQVRHIAGSVDRLNTYLTGNPLSVDQLRELRAESEPLPTRQQLFQMLEHALQRCEHSIAAIAPGDLDLPRGVGRRALPTTVGGLVVHIAEHSQRHLGQAITTAKVVLALRE